MSTAWKVIMSALLGAAIGTAVVVAQSGAEAENDRACTTASCVIVAPTEDSCPAYTGRVEAIQGGGVVCFPG